MYMSDLEHGSTVAGSLILTQNNLGNHTHHISDIYALGNAAYYNKSDSVYLNDSNTIATSAAVNSLRILLDGANIHAAGCVVYSSSTPYLIWSRNSYITNYGSGVIDINFSTSAPSSNYLPVIIGNSGDFRHSFITTNSSAWTCRVTTRAMSYSTSADSGEIHAISFGNTSGLANFYYMIMKV